MTPAPAATESNSSLPLAVLRKKPAFDAAAATGGNAAGILFVAPDGDVLLLRRSSTEPNFAGHWALPGGKAEGDEAPEAAALREAQEEIGAAPNRPMKLLDQRVTPTGMAFHTFAYPVADKFAPKLNGEHSGYCWSPFDQLPAPVHPAVMQTLKERIGVGAAEDMTPDDWKGLRDGFLKWTLEEEVEGEHEAATFDWNESDHPRADSGKFGSGGGNGGGGKAPDDQPKKVGTIAIGSKLPFVQEFMQTHQSMNAQRDYLKKLPRPTLEKALDLIEKHKAIDPSSMHVKAMIKQVLGGGNDSAEIHHASDSLPLAFDRESVREYDKEGRLHVDKAHISKACVNQYFGQEIPGWKTLGLDPQRIYKMLRDPEELKKSAPTFNGIQLLRKHEKVSIDDPRSWDIIGSTGTDAAFDGEYLDNSLHVWAKDGIAGIESGVKKELSSSYRYRADMTPGNFRGSAYDGVMRDIVGNHVAVVEDGRAGPDVVVGDSNEEFRMNKSIQAVAKRAISVNALMTYLEPLIAKDAKPVGIMAKAFDGVTGANFEAKKHEIAKRLRESVEPIIAKDAKSALDSLESILDKVGEREKNAGADESVSSEQHNAMEAAAHGSSELGIPQSVGKEFVSKDAAENLRAHLAQRGMGDEDIKAACDIAFPPQTGMDEEPDDKDDEKKGEKKPPAKDSKTAKDSKMAKDEKKDDDTKKDEDMVSKDEMNAAITAAVAKVNESNRSKDAALTRVRPIMGDLSGFAFDSATDVYRHVLKAQGVKGAETIHASALETLIDILPKAGAKPSHINDPSLANDSASVSDFNKRFPDTARIGH